MSKFKMSKKDRKTLFTTVLLLGKSFVSLGAQSGLDDEDGLVICEIASKVSTNTAALLGYSPEEAMEITREVYRMTEDGAKELSKKTVEDFLNDKSAKA